MSITIGIIYAEIPSTCTCKSDLSTAACACRYPSYMYVADNSADSAEDHEFATEEDHM